MNGSFCAVILQNAFSNSDLKELRTTFIANCVFNNFLSYTAIMLNIITMYAIRRTSSLPKTLKTLLLSLAFSDVGVGLFVQPLYTFSLVKWLKLDRPSCNTYQVWNISSNLFSAASFLGVVAVSVDRVLAVHLHLRYQELVTHKRVVCGDLYMGVQCIYFFIGIVEFLRNSESCSFSYCSYWLYCLLCGVHQDIFNCPTPQETDSVHADTRNCSGW